MRGPPEDSGTSFLVERDPRGAVTLLHEARLEPAFLAND